jgi:hypothetical protein
MVKIPFNGITQGNKNLFNDPVEIYDPDPLKNLQDIPGAI